MMKSIAALAVLVTTIVAGTSPAFARDAYVIDNAGLFSAATVTALNQKISDFNAQTHKEVVVDTEPTVTGSDAKAAAERIFAQQQVNGVLIYVAKSPKTVGVLPDRAAAKYFPAGSTGAIRTAIVDGFNTGNFDGGITNGVDLTLNMYRSHLGSVRTVSEAQPTVVTTRSDTGGGFSMGWIWWLIVLAVIFFIVRGIFRAMSGPRVMPPGYGGGPMGGGYGGPGYGPGYGGPGYGGGGGGGSFFSGLLGGLGGAFLGNELFGRRDEGFNNAGQQAGFGGDAGSNAGDASGFQSDPGQADLGNSSFGSYGGGDSGGGGWGGGDSGGGGGDWGGGGGDSSGGGW